MFAVRLSVKSSVDVHHFENFTAGRGLEGLWTLHGHLLTLQTSVIPLIINTVWHMDTIFRNITRVRARARTRTLLYIEHYIHNFIIDDIPKDCILQEVLDRKYYNVSPTITYIYLVENILFWILSCKKCCRYQKKVLSLQPKYITNSGLTGFTKQNQRRALPSATHPILFNELHSSPRNSGLTGFDSGLRWYVSMRSDGCGTP